MREIAALGTQRNLGRHKIVDLNILGRQKFADILPCLERHLEQFSIVREVLGQQTMHLPPNLNVEF